MFRNKRQLYEINNDNELKKTLFIKINKLSKCNENILQNKSFCYYLF